MSTSHVRPLLLVAASAGRGILIGGAPGLLTEQCAYTHTDIPLPDLCIPVFDGAAVLCDGLLLWIGDDLGVGCA